MNSKDLIETIESLPIIDDFNDFLDYFRNNKVKATKSSKIGPKDCFKINNLLFHSQEVPHNKVQQLKYTVVSLFFHVGKATKLIHLNNEKSSIFIEVNEEQFEYFQSFNKIEKYFSMLKGLWTLCNIDELKEDDYNNGLTEAVSDFLTDIGEKIDKKKAFKKIELHNLGQITKQLGFLGWWDFTEKNYHKSDRKYVDSIKINSFGKFLIPKLVDERPLSYWNYYSRENESYLYDPFFLFQMEKEDIDEDIIDKQLEKVENEPFLEVFKKELGEDVLGKELNMETETRAGIYIFKVKMNNQIWRVIRIPGSCFLDELHRAILDAYDFENDHLYVFYPEGKLFSGIGYHDERGSGATPLACETKIEELGLVERQTMKYLFDFGDHWEFDVVLEEVSGDDSVLDGPELIKSKGDAPDQYPDYDEDEDL
ncbi:MAG: plasmid pRiA4b ORF-3 family protein [Flammeovirgaceae bacterium]|nr:plasmid pRiA4b ORF-3 family protein [Flammeovirgaceae bacterium]